MASDSYARAELDAETWEERLARVHDETCQLISATRQIIITSRKAMRQADERLRIRL